MIRAPAGSHCPPTAPTREGTCPHDTATIRTEVLPLVERERLDLADLLERLDDHEWTVPSLCAGWTVREVAAHLTLSTRKTSLGTVARTVRARGDINAVFAAWARERAAAFAPAEVIAQLRATAGSTHRMTISRRFEGLRFVATDLDWSSGAGSREVRASAADLLLLATGRAAGLAGLSDPGAAEAAARMSA